MRRSMGRDLNNTKPSIEKENIASKFKKAVKEHTVLTCVIGATVAALSFGGYQYYQYKYNPMGVFANKFRKSMNSYMNPQTIDPDKLEKLRRTNPRKYEFEKGFQEYHQENLKNMQNARAGNPTVPASNSAPKGSFSRRYQQ